MHRTTTTSASSLSTSLLAQGLFRLRVHSRESAEESLQSTYVLVIPLYVNPKGFPPPKITSKPSQDPRPYIHSYVFSGPIRYSRHNSPTIGLFANLPDTRLYSTWKMYLKNVPRYFTADLPAQHWNTEYKAAQQIFSGPTSVAVRAPIQAGHRMLYARTTRNGFGVINGPDDVFTLFHGGEPAGPSPARSSSLSLSRLPTSSSISSSSRGSPTRGSPSRSSADLSRFANRIKPTVYTYILSYDDDSFRFSETGAAFFVDFASKHALHSNCAPCVRYSGEFHPRPAGGWARFSDSTPDADVRWELVVDNNSGTYAPDPALLPVLRALLQENFAGFEIVVMDFHEEALKESREACKKYALEHRGVRPEEQEPTRLMGGAEETLAHEARSVPVVAGRAVQDVKQKIKDKLAHAGKAS